jgi:multidrug efflux pump subunit AcrA (membrane-fusion protein)
MLAYTIRFPLALLLSLPAGAAGAQSQPQRGPMTLGVARSGVVQTINVADGDHVEAGHALIALDCGSLAKDIDVLAPSLQATEANYDRVLNGPRPEEIAIGEAGVGVAVARAEEARAALDRPTRCRSASRSPLRNARCRARFACRRRRADGRAQEACSA